MNKKFEHLIRQRQDLENRIEALQTERMGELINDYNNDKITAEKMILSMGKYMKELIKDYKDPSFAGIENVISMDKHVKKAKLEGISRWVLQTMAIILHKKGVHIPEIEKCVRKAFFSHASDVLMMDSPDLLKAGELFGQIGEDMMVKRVQELQNMMFSVGKRIQLKIKMGELDG